MALISIIVPAFNASTTIDELISSVLDGIVEHRREIIVIDDCSSDETAAIAQRYADQAADSRTTISVIRSPVNAGAGSCRNIGMQNANGEFLLFLDADDLLIPGVIDHALRIERAKQADFIVFPYHYVSEGRRLNESGMLEDDKKLWHEVLPQSHSGAADAKKVAKLVLMTNYPWNKLINRRFAQRIGLRFSDTAVNNDIAAHWQLYIHASRIYLHSAEIVFHFVPSQSSQLTKIFDERRFALFTVLSETDRHIFHSEESITYYYEYFMRFKIKLLLWVYRRLPEPLRPAFFEHVSNLYADMPDDALRFLIYKSPDIASSSVALSVNPSAFFAGKNKGL